MISNPLTKNKTYCASEKEKATSTFSESPTYQTTYCLPRQSTVCVCNLYQISSLVAEPGGSKRLKMKLVPSGNCHKPHGWQSLQCESRWLLLLTTVQLNSSALKFITDIKNYNTSDRKTKERWPEILPWSWTQGVRRKGKDTWPWFPTCVLWVGPCGVFPTLIWNCSQNVASTFTDEMLCRNKSRSVAVTSGTSPECDEAFLDLLVRPQIQRENCSKGENTVCLRNICCIWGYFLCFLSFIPTVFGICFL